MTSYSAEKFLSLSYTTLMRKWLSRTLTISLIYQQSAVFHHKTVYVWQRLVVICKRRLDRISREIKIMNWKSKCCPVVYQISTFFKQKKWKRIRYKKIGFSFRSHQYVNTFQLSNWIYWKYVKISLRISRVFVDRNQLCLNSFMISNLQEFHVNSIKEVLF